MALTDFNECLAELEGVDPAIRSEVAKSWASAAKQERIAKRDGTPLLRELRRMAKQVAKLQAQADEVAAQIAKKNEESKPLTPEASQRVAKALVAMSEKLIDTQITLMVRKTGESDAQLYARCLNDHPELYQAYTMAKQGASVNSYQCTFGSDLSATAQRIEKEMSDAKLKPDALTGAAYAEYEAARMRRAA